MPTTSILPLKSYLLRLGKRTMTKRTMTAGTMTTRERTMKERAKRTMRKKTLRLMSKMRLRTKILTHGTQWILQNVARITT